MNNHYTEKWITYIRNTYPEIANEADKYIENIGGD